MTMVIEPRHMSIILDILEKYVQDGTVRVFGSRATGKARPASDLDLLVKLDEPLSFELYCDLKEAFSESDLPFRVDVVDARKADESFLQRILPESELLMGE